jgi:sRNA-binding protein
VLKVDEAYAVHRYYVKGRFFYAKALVAGRRRIDLDGRPDGFVTAADEAAVRPLIKAIELRAARRAEQARAALKPSDKATPPLPSHGQRRASGTIRARGGRILRQSTGLAGDRHSARQGLATSHN